MKKLLINPWSFGIFVIFALLLGNSLQATSQKAKFTRDQRVQLERETAELSRNVASKAATASRSALPFMKEKVGRDELLLIKPGEVVMELPPITSTTSQIKPSPTQTPWQAWMTILTAD